MAPKAKAKARPQKTVASAADDAAELAAFKAQNKAVPTEDKLDKIRVAARKSEELRLEAEGLQERISELNKERNALLFDTIPSLLAEAQIPKLTVGATGNVPSFVVEAGQYVNANIAVSWPEEKKRKAFDYLVSLKAGDLIKLAVAADLGKGEQKLAKQVVAALKKLKVQSVSMKESVHAASLKSWVKERLDKNLPVDLDIVGATTGMIANIKPVKD